MVKINREYLDPALQALNEHNNALLKKYNAQQEAVHSASQAVADRQHSKLISSRNLSRGGMISIVLVGFGIMVALIAWSLPRLVGQLRNPVATVQPILSSSELKAEPSSTVVSGSSSDTVKDAPPPALIVPKYSREQGATGCIKGESFRSPCIESVVLENGSTYNGTWSNGAANGEGEITFLDDGSVRGTWQDGALIEILEVSTPAASPTITSSVTLFTTKTVTDLSSKFRTVSVGHKFNSPSDTTWESAYCYTLVMERGDQVMIDLSRIENFNEKIILIDYKSNSKISRDEYKRAQEMCPYKYTNF